MGCSLKPSWPIHEATKLRHTAMLCLLEQELNISAARLCRLSHDIDNRMTKREFRLNQELSQVS